MHACSPCDCFAENFVLLIEFHGRLEVLVDVQWTIRDLDCYQIVPFDYSIYSPLLI